MTDNTRATLDRLLDEVPIGPAPIETLLKAGHRAKRRKQATLVGAAGLATAVVLGGGAAATQWPTTDPNPSNSEVAANGNTRLVGNQVTVHTALEGPEAYYFEGALTEVALAPAGTADSLLTRDSDPQRVGATTTWDDVATGDWTLTASTRPCSGSCDEVDPPTDTCAADMHVAGPTTVLVTYHWGKPCQVQVRGTAMVGSVSPACDDLEAPLPPVPATPTPPVPGAQAQHLAINQAGTVAAWFDQTQRLPQLLVFDLTAGTELAREDLGVGDVAPRPSLRILGPALYFRSAADPDVWLRFAWEDDEYPLVYLTCR